MTPAYKFGDLVVTDALTEDILVVVKVYPYSGADVAWYKVWSEADDDWYVYVESDLKPNPPVTAAEKPLHFKRLGGFFKVSVLEECGPYIPADAVVVYAVQDPVSWSLVYKGPDDGKFYEVSKEDGREAETMRLTARYVAELMSAQYESELREALEALK